jgi:hypothetical protein
MSRYPFKKIYNINKIYHLIEYQLKTKFPEKGISYKNIIGITRNLKIKFY